MRKVLNYDTGSIPLSSILSQLSCRPMADNRYTLRDQLVITRRGMGGGGGGVGMATS